VSNTIEKIWNRFGVTDNGLDTGSLVSFTYIHSHDLFPSERVPSDILLGYSTYSRFFTLEPLDKLPDWRVVMFYHTEKPAVPPFTYIICTMAIGSGVMDIPFTKWIGSYSSRKLEIGVPITLGANHTNYATDVYVLYISSMVCCPWDASYPQEPHQLIGMLNHPAYHRTIEGPHSGYTRWPVQASGSYARCSESGGKYPLLYTSLPNTPATSLSKPSTKSITRVCTFISNPYSSHLSTTGRKRSS